MKDKELEGYLFNVFHSCIACLLVASMLQAVLIWLMPWKVAIAIGMVVGVIVVHYDHKDYKEKF